MGSDPGQFIWNLRRTKGPWGRVFSQYFAFSCQASFRHCPWNVQQADKPACYHTLCRSAAGVSPARTQTGSYFFKESEAKQRTERQLSAELHILHSSSRTIQVQNKVSWYEKDTWYVRRRRIYTELWYENLKERDYLRNRGVNGMTEIDLTEVRRYGLNWIQLAQDSVTKSCTGGNEPSGHIKSERFLD